MTRKSLQDWYNSNDISYSEKERLNKFDDPTSNFSYEKGKIEQYIREAENNHSYTRSRYQIEKEKFQERIEVYPKDWCRIS